MTTIPEPQHTQRTLEQARQHAVAHQITSVVVVSPLGDIGLTAVSFRPKEVSNLVVVSHNTGFSQYGAQQMSIKFQDYRETGRF